MDIFVILDTQDMTVDVAYEKEADAILALELLGYIKIMDRQYAISNYEWHKGNGFSIQKVKLRRTR